MNNQPDERSVYLALNNVFRGPDALLRQGKKIRKAILKQHNDIDVRALIDAYTIEKVCNVAKALLEERIFESTLRAKIRFPEVFEVSPAQSAERSASEEEAAQSEADAILIAAEQSSQQAIIAHTSGRAFGKRRAGDVIAENCAASVHNKKNETKPIIPSLYPVYLPYQTQHKLLSLVQQALEIACYEFSVRDLPAIVEEEGWDCPEALELNHWTRIMNGKHDVFQPEDIAELGKPVKDLLESTAQIRHTAVHRLRISANRLGLYLQDAESLAKLLRKQDCAQSLSRVRREAQFAVEDIMRNKDLLESQLAVRLRNLARQRAELDRLEKLAVANMTKEDQQYAQFVGGTLIETISAPATALHSTAVTERDDDSDQDVILAGRSSRDMNLCEDDWASQGE